MGGASAVIAAYRIADRRSFLGYTFRPRRTEHAAGNDWPRANGREHGQAAHAGRPQLRGPRRLRGGDPGAGRGAILPTPGRQGRAGTAEEGYLHCGPSGAGHFVKMVHNGIEYGLMAAYAEGLNILKHADVGRRTEKADAETAPLRGAEYYQY